MEDRVSDPATDLHIILSVTLLVRTHLSLGQTELYLTDRSLWEGGGSSAQHPHPSRQPSQFLSWQKNGHTLTCTQL